MGAAILQLLLFFGVWAFIKIRNECRSRKAWIEYCENERVKGFYGELSPKLKEELNKMPDVTGYYMEMIANGYRRAEEYHFKLTEGPMGGIITYLMNQGLGSGYLYASLMIKAHEDSGLMSKMNIRMADQVLANFPKEHLPKGWEEYGNILNLDTDKKIKTFDGVATSMAMSALDHPPEIKDILENPERRKERAALIEKLNIVVE